MNKDLPKFTGEIAVVSDSHYRGSQWSDRARSVPFSQAMLAAVDMARRRGVLILCHGGDILQSNQPEPEPIKHLRDLDKALRGLGMVMFLVSGNHDSTQGTQWPEAVLDVKDNADNGTGIVFLRDNLYISHRHGISVVGVSPVEKGVGKKGILDSAASKGPATVLICHAPVQEFTGSTSIHDIAATEFPGELYGAIVVGDTHEHHVVQHPRFPDVPIISPGSTEIHTVDEATYTPEKYVTFVKFKAGKVVAVEKVPLPVTRCKTFNFFRDDLFAQECTDMAKETAGLPPKSIVVIRYHRDLNPSVVRVAVTEALSGRDLHIRFNILPYDKPSEVHETDTQAPAQAEEEIELIMPVLSDALEKWPSGNDRLDGIRRRMLTSDQSWEAALDTLLDDVAKGTVTSVV